MSNPLSYKTYFYNNLTFTVNKRRTLPECQARTLEGRSHLARYFTSKVRRSDKETELLQKKCCNHIFST